MAGQPPDTFLISSDSGLVPLQAVEKALLDSVPKGTEDLNMKALRKGYDNGREQSTPIS